MTRVIKSMTAVFSKTTPFLACPIFNHELLAQILRIESCFATDSPCRYYSCSVGLFVVQGHPGRQRKEWFGYRLGGGARCDENARRGAERFSLGRHANRSRGRDAMAALPRKWVSGSATLDARAQGADCSPIKSHDSVFHSRDDCAPLFRAAARQRDS